MMDLSLTDTQRNGSEEARGGTARRRDSLWGGSRWKIDC